MENPGCKDIEDNQLNEIGIKTEKDIDEEKPASFEDVVRYLGFGKFNIFLILLTTPAMWCNHFETTTISYIFTSAKCDLNLSMQTKGLLNSVVYAGMISSALIWGYLGDTLGRKRIVFVGLLLDFMFIVGSALSQNITWLIICKFFGGFIINGPFSALTTYLSEFHSSKYRPMIQLYFGCMISVGLVILPLIGWGVLINTWEIEIFQYFKLHSWNVFLLLSGLPAFLGVISLPFLPESPKFLMSSGNNEAAMKIFKKIYSINTGNPPDTFPFKKLLDEKHFSEDQQEDYANRSKLQVMADGLKQIKPLFEWTLLKKLILMCFLEMFTLQSQNMIRLWTPQMLQAYEVYKETHNGTSTYFCDTLDILREDVVESTHVDEICSMQNEHSQVYINAILIGTVNTISYAVSGTVLKLIGKNKLIWISQFIAAGAGLGMYFSTNEMTTTGLIMTLTSLQIVTAMIILNFTVDIFPTTLRLLTVCIVLMIARIGIVGANLLFPILLAQGCALPFSCVSALCLASAILGFFLPNTDHKALE